MNNNSKYIIHTYSTAIERVLACVLTDGSIGRRPERDEAIDNNSQLEFTEHHFFIHLS